MQNIVLVFGIISTALAAFPKVSLQEHPVSGLCGKEKQFAGYITVDRGVPKHYFFWYFESRDQPSSDPLFMWLTGGPGCASTMEMVTEMGPCRVKDDGSGTVENLDSWTNHANGIWIDQPAGVGYSYGGNQSAANNETEVADDMYLFLQHFFAAHKDLQGRQFFVTGSSYGGHFVPSVSHRIFVGNQNARSNGDIPINLVGVTIGNGLIQPTVQYQYYPLMAYNYSMEKIGEPVISLNTYETMLKDYPKCHKMALQCQIDNSVCAEGMTVCNDAFFTPYFDTGRNPYNIKEQCEIPPLCYNETGVILFFNDPHVQAELGVSARKWETCNMDVYKTFSADWLHDFNRLLPDMLEAGIRIMIYAGDLGYICNWLGNRAVALGLDWQYQKEFNDAPVTPWRVDGKHAGEIRTAHGFTFLRVFDAGHMVPLDQPHAAAVLMHEFMHQS